MTGRVQSFGERSRDRGAATTLALRPARRGGSLRLAILRCQRGIGRRLCWFTKWRHFSQSGDELKASCAAIGFGDQPPCCARRADMADQHRLRLLTTRRQKSQKSRSGAGVKQPAAHPDDALDTRADQSWYSPARTVNLKNCRLDRQATSCGSSQRGISWEEPYERT